MGSLKYPRISKDLTMRIMLGRQERGCFLIRWSHFWSFWAIFGLGMSYKSSAFPTKTKVGITLPLHNVNTLYYITTILQSFFGCFGIFWILRAIICYFEGYGMFQTLFWG